MSEIHDLAAPFVLGALDAAELEAFESHLDSCDECPREIEELGEGLAAMAFDDVVPPPAPLRQKVMRSIEPRRRGAGVLVAIAAAVIAVLGGLAIFDTDPVDKILSAADAVSVPLLATDAYGTPAPELSQVVFSASEASAEVEFSGLAPPGATMTYQLWLIDEDGPVSAGTFTSGPDGAVAVLLDGVAVPGQVVGITEEPEGGSASPTGDVLFVAEI